VLRRKGFCRLESAREGAELRFAYDTSILQCCVLLFVFVLSVSVGSGFVVFLEATMQ
jgi:hypothetical protein